MLKVKCSVTAFASGFAMIFHVPAKVMQLATVASIVNVTVLWASWIRMSFYN